jgi:formamidopyrimidine-DNA glycosylase
MPEGPEVIITTQYLNNKLKNKKPTDIKVISGRYTHQKLQGINLLKNTNLIIKRVNSKGKFIWFDIKDIDSKKDIYLMNTLGMTGIWSFNEKKSNRVVITIENKTGKTTNLYFTDARNFGTIVITSDKSVLDKRLNKLAPDILRSNMTNEQLLEITKQYISKSRANKNVVKVLMNQNAIVSGIGNYLVAEILYDARISPFTNLNEISSNKLKKLVHSMRKITKMAYYDNITGYMVNFKEFGNNHLKMVEDRVFPNYLPDIVGKKFRFNVYQQEKDSKGNIVKRDEIVKGRTIHWVPSVQT